MLDTAGISELEPLQLAARLRLGSRSPGILIVNDDNQPTHVLERHLKALGGKVHILDSTRDVVATAETHSIDVILLEIAMANPDMIRVVSELRKERVTHATPIVVLVTGDDADCRIRCLEEGASDVITQPVNPDEVVARLQVILSTKLREDLLRRRVGFLEELASSDPLTSALNQRAFIDRLHLEMERAVRSERPLSCLILDIDWFKRVNDQYGHHVGDDVLRQVAKILVDGCRSGDAVCRYGGEEFVWLLPGVDEENLKERAEQVRRKVEETDIPTTEDSFHVTVSVGASTFLLKAHGRISGQLLVEQADMALLEAKRLGKNRVVFREILAQDSGNDDPPTRPAPKPVLDARADDRRTLGSDLRATPAAGMIADTLEALTDEANFQEELRAVYLSSVEILAEALEARDPETMAHCYGVANTAVGIAMEMKVPPQEIERIKLASMLHDLGKLAIPDSILRKPAPLSREEWTIVKKHPERGAAMLQDKKLFNQLAELILHHQESFDGSGYPDGLAGSAIPLGARIIRVADTFDALTSDRPYRARMKLEEAKAELRQMAGTALDPVVVETLLQLLGKMAPVEIELFLRGQRGTSTVEELSGLASTP